MLYIILSIDYGREPQYSYIEAENYFPNGCNFTGNFGLWSFFGSEYDNEFGLLPQCGPSATSSTSGTS